LIFLCTVLPFSEAEETSWMLAIYWLKSGRNFVKMEKIDIIHILDKKNQNISFSMPR
jgi:hypothetical protein